MLSVLADYADSHNDTVYDPIQQFGYISPNVDTRVSDTWYNS